MTISRIACLLGALLCAPLALAQSQETYNPAEVPSTTLHAPAPTQVLGFPILLDERPDLITQVGGGAGGADASRLQNSSLAMAVLGFSVSVAGATRLADDFVVPAAGWTITDITVYSYQTGSTTTSTFTDLNFRIWDGDPSLGTSTVVFGDTTTNRLSFNSFSNIYRETETSLGATNRPIMALSASGLSINLSAGTYWLDWQAGGSLGSGPWGPPKTILGQTTTGNAVQSVGGVWAAIADSGTLTPQGIPMRLNGTVNAVDADVGIAKSAQVAGALSIGSGFTYTLIASNSGPGDATGVVVTDTLPAQVGYVSNDCGAGFSAPTLTWNIGALANGASATCIVSVSVLATGAIDNTASIAATSTDPNPANASSTIGIAGAAPPALPVPATSLWSLLLMLAGVAGIVLVIVRQR